MTSSTNRYFCTLVTPFAADGSIDEDSYRNLLRYLVRGLGERGGLCANAEAAETFYLDRGERRRLLEIAMEEVDGAMPVFSGSYAPTTAEVVETAKDAKAIGADGLFAIPPSGSGDVTATWDADRYPEVWIDQLLAQVRAVDMPIITHPSGSMVVPVYGKGIPLRATEAICRAVPNVVGWKMTYPYDANKRITAALRALDRPVSVLQSGAYYFHEFLAEGNFDGTMSGYWNLSTEPMLEHIGAWQRNDSDSAREIWLGGLRDLQSYVKSDGRMHIRYKIGAWLRGHIARPDTRAPMPAPTPEEIDRMYKLMQRVGLGMIEPGQIRARAS